MDAQTYAWIVRIFRSTDGNGFDGPDDTAAVLDAWLQNHAFTADQLVRYMLVGFWPMYRAVNHLGGEMSTRPEHWNLDRHPWTRHKAMVATFNGVFGRSIKDTADYLAVLGCTSYDRLGLMVRRGMARYVLDGHTAEGDDGWPGVRRV